MQRRCKLCAPARPARTARLARAAPHAHTPPTHTRRTIEKEGQLAADLTVQWNITVAATPTDSPATVAGNVTVTPYGNAIDGVDVVLNEEAGGEDCAVGAPDQSGNVFPFTCKVANFTQASRTVSATLVYDVNGTVMSVPVTVAIPGTLVEETGVTGTVTGGRARARPRMRSLGARAGRAAAAPRLIAAPPASRPSPQLALTHTHRPPARARADPLPEAAGNVAPAWANFTLNANADALPATRLFNQTFSCADAVCPLDVTNTAAVSWAGADGAAKVDTNDAAVTGVCQCEAPGVPSVSVDASTACTQTYDWCAPRERPRAFFTSVGTPRPPRGRPPRMHSAETCPAHSPLTHPAQITPPPGASPRRARWCAQTTTTTRSSGPSRRRRS